MVSGAQQLTDVGTRLDEFDQLIRPFANHDTIFADPYGGYRFGVGQATELHWACDDNSATEG